MYVVVFRKQKCNIQYKSVISNINEPPVKPVKQKVLHIFATLKPKLKCHVKQLSVLSKNLSAVTLHGKLLHNNIVKKVTTVVKYKIMYIFQFCFYEKNKLLSTVVNMMYILAIKCFINYILLTIKYEVKKYMCITIHELITVLRPS